MVFREKVIQFLLMDLHVGLGGIELLVAEQVLRVSDFHAGVHHVSCGRCPELVDIQMRKTVFAKPRFYELRKSPMTERLPRPHSGEDMGIIRIGYAPRTDFLDVAFDPKESGAANGYDAVFFAFRLIEEKRSGCIGNISEFQSPYFARPESR